MKIQAIISIDIDAADVQDVETRRNRIERAVGALGSEYPPTRSAVKTRRPRTAPRAAPSPKLEDGFEVVRVRYVG